MTTWTASRLIGRRLSKGRPLLSVVGQAVVRSEAFTNVHQPETSTASAEASTNCHQPRCCQNVRDRVAISGDRACRLRSNLCSGGSMCTCTSGRHQGIATATIWEQKLSNACPRRARPSIPADRRSRCRPGPPNGGPSPGPNPGAWPRNCRLDLDRRRSRLRYPLLRHSRGAQALGRRVVEDGDRSSPSRRDL